MLKAEWMNHWAVRITRRYSQTQHMLTTASSRWTEEKLWTRKNGVDFEACTRRAHELTPRPRTSLSPFTVPVVAAAAEVTYAKAPQLAATLSGRDSPKLYFDPRLKWNSPGKPFTVAESTACRDRDCRYARLESALRFSFLQSQITPEFTAKWKGHDIHPVPHATFSL